MARALEPYCVKGVAYRDALDYIAEFVPGGLAAVQALLPSDVLRDFFAQRFLPSNWYDISPFPILDQMTACVLQRPFEEHMRKSSRWQAERELRGFYKLFLGAVSPGIAARLLVKWGEHFLSFGRCEAVPIGENKLEVRWHGTPEDVSRWLVLAASEYVMVAMEKAGAGSVGIELMDDVPEGEREGRRIVQCTHRVRWSK